MARPPIPTWYFALAVVRMGRRFLLTQEKKYGECWSIPGGRVEIGESLVDAAVREVLEETGVPIHLDGVLRVEHEASGNGARVRVIYVATPTDDRAPKTTPDEESLGAAWLTLEEIRGLKLRGADLRALLEMVANGCPIYPLELIGRELSV
ncbi:MAG TPA: NUDIX domain-containing protein [Kofleriaceae bacterium]|nr:NUDIX domain-containing protein [Kofleriaceae bacterium]